MAKDTLLKEPWLKWSIEIQSIAQNGLAYVRDEYDRERYERLRDIAAEMLSYQRDISKETEKSLFCCNEGYQTPKIDRRASIFQDERIPLLVQEKNGTWSLPGGCVGVGRIQYDQRSERSSRVKCKTSKNHCPSRS